MQTVICRAIAIVVCMVSTGGSWAQQVKNGNDVVLGLVAVLESEAAIYDKAMACRALSVKGDERAISALAALLSDRRLSTYARSALEAIPGDAASRALRESINSLEGETLAGVLGSIGKRRDAGAVSQLSRLLNVEDGRVASAAARALGQIGTAEAAGALQTAITQVPDTLRPVLAWAVLDCAARLERTQEEDLARDIYDSIRQAELPRPVVVAATKRAIVLGGPHGRALLSEVLDSDDEQQFRAGLQVARELGPTSTNLLLQHLETASAVRQVLLLIALSDVGGPDAFAAIFKAADSPVAMVREQAMPSLSQFPSPKVVKKLFQALGDREAVVADAATDALSTMKSDDVDQGVVTVLQNQESAVMARAVELARRRQIEAASQSLFTMAEEEYDVAATRALGSTIDLADMPRLVRLAMRASGEQRVAAQQALSTACARLPREACAKVLASSIERAAIQDQVMLLDVLGSLGGETALRTVSALARADEDLLQDAATRLLGTWPTSDVAPTLRELVTVLESPKYRIRALRAYIRVARQLEMETPERITVCRNAIDLAERFEEKQLVLDVLRRRPTADGLALAMALLEQEELQNDAFSAVLTIGPHVVRNQPSAADGILQRASGLPPEQLRVLADELFRTRALVFQAEHLEGFVPLFDGKTFEGWHGNLEIFRIEDVQIVGGNLEQPIERNEFLRTDKSYGDFELRLEFKLLGEQPNAGVQIRTQEIPDDHEVRGYQADLGPGWWGCLYDESRRNRILAGRPADERGKPVRANEWNDYRIRCEGRRIRLWINGMPTVDYTERDPAIPQRGIIAVQIHSGGPAEARYRNLRVKQLPSPVP